MKFKANTRRRAIEYEKDLVQYWKKNKTFEKSIENRPAENGYVFYDGPPFITGVPHHGTLLSSVVKDAVPRYQTMKGKRVERVWGWDTHGLPAENFVEKKLGITDRHEIGTKISLEEYITTARESMIETGGLWESTIDRIGRWVDFKGDYKTMDKDYMESVWWAFKQLYEKGKIYEGEKVLMYDTKWATPLSKAEVTMDAGAYVDVTDPSVYVKFKLADSESTAEVVNDRLRLTTFIDAPLEDVWDFTLNPENTPKYFDSISYEEFSELPAKEGTIFRNHGDDQTKWNEVQVIDFKKHESFTLESLDGEFRVEYSFAHKDGGTAFVYEEWNVDKTPIETSTNVKVVQKLKKELENANDIYLLAWTTTPWTLPGNVALAVNEEIEYAEIELDDERFIAAKALLNTIFTDEKHNILNYKIIRAFSGKELVGKTYEPLFENRGENAHKIWAADYVTTESGTGIVHLAPAYGEEDFELAKQKNIPVVHVLDEYGVYTEGPWQGLEVWENNKRIAKELKEQGVVWKIDYIKHEYPHNPRTGHRLMYRAHPSWFMDIDGQRIEMLEQNNHNINWFPEHIKNGRFEKTVETAPDWNLSRDRFWATAMPVWKGDKGSVKVMGSYAELKELSGVELEDYHRPWVDDITFDIDGEHFTRIDKVIDCWFESGSMPFAQFHYPFENVEKFEANFPGDFIVEYVGQVRAWFYYMHAVNVGLFGHNAFKNVIVTGNVAGNDGYKMSKSRGNFTDPVELMDKYSADSWRLLLLSSPLLGGEDFSLIDKDVSDTARKLSMIWNMYDFFTMYAEVDGWEYDGTCVDPSEDLSNPLDQWIVSRVHQLIQEIEKNMDVYDIASAMKPILPFVDDASNWYVRRSRRRFWKSEDDDDKNNAYKTLHYVLVRLSQALAPFTPFLAEELYRNLTGEESVHLIDWPEVGHVNELVVKDMEAAREYVNQALSLRAQAGMKIRQPLASVTVPSLGEFVNFEDILTEELNVKAVMTGDELALDLNITPELYREGLMREVIRHVQSARKQAGLNVDDRIALRLSTEDSELQKAIDEFTDEIDKETLATTHAVGDEDHYSTSAKIDDFTLGIALHKA